MYIFRYLAVVTFLLLLAFACRRKQNLQLEDYNKEFPFAGIDKAPNSYEDLNIRFCDAYVDPDKFRSPMVVLDNPHTYKITIKFKFKCDGESYGSGGGPINYKIRFIDSCGKLRCIQPNSNFCSANTESSEITGANSDNSNSDNNGEEEGEEEVEEAEAAAQSSAIDRQSRNPYVSYASYVQEEEQETSETSTAEKQDPNQAFKEKLEKCDNSYYYGDGCGGSSDGGYSRTSTQTIDSITFRVRSGYPMYLSVSGSGPRGSGVEASIQAVAEDGYIIVPKISTNQTQNRIGSDQLQEPLCQYIILP